MANVEEEINITDGNLKLNLVRTEFCDDGWLDLTIENIENGRCTSYGIQEADILCALMPLIDTEWVLEGAEDEKD